MKPLGNLENSSHPKTTGVCRAFFMIRLVFLVVMVAAEGVANAGELQSEKQDKQLPEAAIVEFLNGDKITVKKPRIVYLTSQPGWIPKHYSLGYEIVLAENKKPLYPVKKSKTLKVVDISIIEFHCKDADKPFIVVHLRTGKKITTSDHGLTYIDDAQTSPDFLGYRFLTNDHRLRGTVASEGRQEEFDKAVECPFYKTTPDRIISRVIFLQKTN